MRTGEHIEHATEFVVFDEAHAPHVGSELIDNIRANDRLCAVLFFTQVQGEILDVGIQLEPVFQGFDIHCPNNMDSTIQETLYEMASDKTARSSDDRLEIAHGLLHSVIRLEAASKTIRLDC